MPRARRQLDRRGRDPLDLLAQNRTDRIVELNRRQVDAGVEVERVQKARESLLVGRARVDRQPNAAGITFTAPGSTSSTPTVATAPSIAFAASRTRSTYSDACTSAS